MIYNKWKVFSIADTLGDKIMRKLIGWQLCITAGVLGIYFLGLAVVKSELVAQALTVISTFAFFLISTVPNFRHAAAANATVSVYLATHMGAPVVVAIGNLIFISIFPIIVPEEWRLSYWQIWLALAAQTIVITAAFIGSITGVCLGVVTLLLLMIKKKKTYGLMVG